MVASNGSKSKGPKPGRVKIDMDWEQAVDKALKKPRPKEGWPEPDKSPKKKSKK